MNRVIDNLGCLGYLLYFSKSNITSYNYNNDREIIQEINTNNNIISHIANDIYINDDNILGKLKKLDTLKGREYTELYNKVIQVGEYDN